MQSPSLLSPGSFFFFFFPLGWPVQMLVTRSNRRACLLRVPGGKARGCSPAASPGAGGPSWWDSGGDRAVRCSPALGGTVPGASPITWVTLGGQSWHGAALAVLGRGQAQRQPDSTERWRREHRQSICDAHRFLMRPVACLALRGSIRRRCLEKLSTAHCSKTLDYLTATARSPGGRGEQAQGWTSPAASIPPTSGHVSPILGMDTEGTKVKVLATCRGSPHGSPLPKGVLPSPCKRKDILGSSDPNPPYPRLPASSLPGCKWGCRKQRLTAPTQQPWKKAAKGQLLG